MNLGLSENFGFVDYEHLVFPALMKVDWVRVYQDPNNINLGCDPPDFPTKAYIEECVVHRMYRVRLCLLMSACTDTSRHILTRT